eukprot:g21320.t1
MHEEESLAEAPGTLPASSSSDVLPPEHLPPPLDTDREEEPQTEAIEAASGSERTLGGRTCGGQESALTMEEKVLEELEKLKSVIHGHFERQTALLKTVARGRRCLRCRRPPRWVLMAASGVLGVVVLFKSNFLQGRKNLSSKALKQVFAGRPRNTPDACCYPGLRCNPKEETYKILITQGERYLAGESMKSSKSYWKALFSLVATFMFVLVGGGGAGGD